MQQEKEDRCVCLNRGSSPQVTMLNENRQKPEKSQSVKRFLCDSVRRTGIE